MSSSAFFGANPRPSPSTASLFTKSHGFNISVPPTRTSRPNTLDNSYASRASPRVTPPTTNTISRRPSPAPALLRLDPVRLCPWCDPPAACELCKSLEDPARSNRGASWSPPKDDPLFAICTPPPPGRDLALLPGVLAPIPPPTWPGLTGEPPADIVAGASDSPPKDGYSMGFKVPASTASARW